MRPTHVSLDEPFFQFDPFEGLNSANPSMSPAPSDFGSLTVDDDPLIQTESEVGASNPIDKGKGVSRPMPIMISPLEASEFDEFTMSPTWSVSSSYPDSPNTHMAFPSPGSSSFPSFTLGSFSSVAVPLQSSSSDVYPDTLVAGSSQDMKGKGKERDDARDDAVPPIPPLTFSSSAFGSIGVSQESARPAVDEFLKETSSTTADRSEPSYSATSTIRGSPTRRHSFSHAVPRSRRPSSLTRFKARFILPSRAHTRKVISRKLSPAQLATPQLTQITNVHTHLHTHLPTSLSLEVNLPLDEGALETTDFCVSLFRTKGRSNSSPLPMSALDYIPILPEDAFIIRSSRNFFDEVLPKELKLQIILSLISLHKNDKVKLIAQADWSVTRAVSSKNRWLGKDKAIRELVKLGRVCSSCLSFSELSS